MKIERFPLQDRLALLDTGRCAHPEYAAAIIHRFADMPLPEYFRGFEAELERLSRLCDAETDLTKKREITREILRLTIELKNF